MGFDNGSSVFFILLLITVQTDHKSLNIIIIYSRCFLGHHLGKEVVGTKLSRKRSLRSNNQGEGESHTKQWMLL